MWVEDREGIGGKGATLRLEGVETEQFALRAAVRSFLKQLTGESYVTNGPHFLKQPATQASWGLCQLTLCLYASIFWSGKWSQICQPSPLPSS